MKKRRALVAAAALVLFLCARGFSMEAELLLLMDIPMVVTAAKTEQPLFEAPATIEVITAREIEALGLRTLADALRLVPGMDVMNVGWTVYFSPRGLNNRRVNTSVLCLLDGHPFNEVTQGSVDPLWIPLTGVKRIEIIKGPGSALYGANAFAGVINIITKTADDIGGTRASAGAGSFNTQKQEFLYGSREDGRETVFTFSHFKTDALMGHSINDNDARDDTQVFGKVSENGFTVTGEYYRTRAGVSGTSDVPSTDAEGRAERGYASVDYSWSGAGGVNIRLMSRVLKTYQYIENSLMPGLASTPVESDGMQVGSEAQVQCELSPHHSLIGGAEWKQDSNDSKAMGGRKSVETKAAYLQEEWRPSYRTILTLGARFDAPSAYQKELSPRMHFLYRLSNESVIRASYGQAFRAPNFLEMYGDMWFGGGSVHFLGNPDIKTERISTTEVGYFHQFGPRTQAGVNLFHINAVNTSVIQTSTIPGGPLGKIYIVRYDNNDQVEILGGEATLKWELSPGLETGFSYSYQDARDRALNEEQTLAPRHKFTMRWDYFLSEQVRLNTSTYYVGEKFVTVNGTSKEYVPGYSVTDARLSSRLDSNLGLSLTFYNLFGARYEDMPTHPFAGKSVLAEIHFTF